MRHRRFYECSVLTIAAMLPAILHAAPPAASSPAPTTTPTTRPAVVRAILPIQETGRDAEYWLRLPVGYADGQRPALLILLHGTDDTAKQMLEFWSQRQTPVPVLLAAPQGQGRGWSEADLPTIRAMWADLRAHASFDPDRIMLAGFSAGGAMTFELLYKERLPITAAAALANYVPPRITSAEVSARATVPVFYAVGMSDLNQERMRLGLDFLRDAGAAIHIYRPRIGHTLDPQVAQSALDWFFTRTHQATDAAIERAAENADVAAAVRYLEDLAGQARWYEPDLIRKAAEIRQQREAPGENDLRVAEGLVVAGQPVDAAELFRQVESTYGQTRLGHEARRRREQLETDVTVKDELARRDAARRADEALSLYSTAQRYVTQSRWLDAAACCRRVLSHYGDTPAAERAQRLLDLLENRSKP